MNRFSRPLALLPGLCAAVLLLQPVTPGFAGEAGSAPRDGVFIHISHGLNSPHRVLMALKMAGIMAADHDVLVYFDIEGVQVVLKDSPDLTYGPFPSSLGQLKALAEAGVLLQACPNCLKAAGKSPEDLAEGIQVADKDSFFAFTKGRILTLDY